MSPEGSRARSLTLVAACGLAAAVFVFRAVRTLVDGWPPSGADVVGAVLALLAAALTVLAVLMARRDLRRAGIPLAWALLLELALLDQFAAPPRYVAALPIMLALAVALVPEVRGRRDASARGEAGTATDPWRRVTTVIAFVLMLPVGFAYLSSGLVAPVPDVFAVYLIFGFFVAGAVRLASMRSLWVLAVPFVASGTWLLMIWMGESFLGWAP